MTPVKSKHIKRVKTKQRLPKQKWMKNRVVTKFSTTNTMLLPLSLHLLLHFSLLTAALPAALPDPDPVLPLPTTTATTPATIPAFPEQSDVSSPSASSSSSCPLSLSPDLISSLSASCHSTLSPARCCPSLAASLYSAFAPTALSLPAAASLPLPDLPALPDDSESCAGQVEKSLRAKGVRLPRLNQTCDVAYCYCGVRLRRLTCAGGGGFVEDGKAGRWAATPAVGRRLRRDCRRPGIAGCSRCLKSLNQLNTNKNVSRSNKSRDSSDSRECQLMGLTWLLSKNRTLYLPAATSVLRAFMAAGDAGPATCSIPHDEMPFAVGSDEFGSGGSPATAAVTLSTTILLMIVMFFFP